MTDIVYTIGHSTHSIERFIELLKSASITAVSDVRSRPYSRMNPQFNREPLRKALRAEDVKYVFLGKELGARSEDRSCYRNGQVHYDLLAKTELFREGTERVKEGARSFRIALMCAEKEPLECHRTILVARRLVEQGLKVKHILADGSTEDHEQTIERLVQRLRVPGSDMFRSPQEVVAEAYARQGSEIAFHEHAPAADQLAGAAE
ncbi:MAG TPA: DUF488 domain-containing protein [Acetobacteraceae bacterium]|nr:DUF488 domain-containing protein [Acetobacteraceae bacterium]